MLCRFRHTATEVNNMIHPINLPFHSVFGLGDVNVKPKKLITESKKFIVLNLCRIETQFTTFKFTNS